MAKNEASNYSSEDELSGLIASLSFDDRDWDKLLSGVLDESQTNITGSTPDSVFENLKETGKYLHRDLRSYLVTAFCIAAVGRRSLLNDYLRPRQKWELKKYITKYWSIKGRPNMTSMGLVGHCLAAAFGRKAHPSVMGLRKILRAYSIWHSQFTGDHMSEQQRRIFFEKKEKTEASDARTAGKAIGLFICDLNNFGPQDVPTTATSDEL